MQNIEKKRNTQNETANTINLNPSNITKCELLREDRSNTKSNPSIQQKEHKQFAFIIGGNSVKNIDGYLSAGSIERKFIVKVRHFSSAKAVDMQDYINPNRGSLFRGSFSFLGVCVGGGGGKITPCKMRYNYARNLKLLN